MQDQHRRQLSSVVKFLHVVHALVIATLISRVKSNARQSQGIQTTLSVYSMAQYSGPRLTHGAATKWIYDFVINGRDLDPERGLCAFRLVMGAYPAHAFPLSERAARLARMAHISYDKARLIVKQYDQVLEPLPIMSQIDPELLRLNCDDEYLSCMPRSVPVILACVKRDCAFCGGILAAPVDDGPLGSGLLHQGRENSIMIQTPHGEYLCHEFIRTCSHCTAVNYVSHAEHATLGVRARKWSEVDVLRIHRRRFASADIIDRALVQYHLAFVPVYTAAHLARVGSLECPKYEQMNPDTLQRALSMRSLIFWHQEVANNDPMYDDMSFAFGTNHELRHHLIIETRDVDFDNQGIYPKLLKAQAINHKHLDGETAACDGIAQDGNSDARYKIKEDGKMPIGICITNKGHSAFSHSACFR